MMLSFFSSVRRGRAAFSVAAVAAAALMAACADQPTAAPSLSPATPRLATVPTFTVTNTNDNGAGSLRAAVAQAPAGAIVDFDVSLAGQTIVLDSSLSIRTPITIEGPTPRGITLSGGGKVRVVSLGAPDTTYFRNVSIRDGYAPGQSGGGIYAGAASFVFEHGTISHNTAGAAAALYGNRVSLINATISHNTSSTSPTVYWAVLASDLKVINSTIVDNVGKGIGLGGVTTMFRNSIVSGNSGGDCSTNPASVTFEGTNIFGDGSCGTGTGIIVADPQLDTLADNGGPGLTHALGYASPARNAGTSCSEATDERYQVRDPQCDVGAFEAPDPTLVTLTIDANTMVSQVNGWAYVTGTATCTRDETFEVAVTLQQAQRVGRGSTTVQASGSAPVACTGTARPWTVALVPASGAFMTGSAAATAKTQNAKAWVKPASASSAVKLFYGRR